MREKRIKELANEYNIDKNQSIFSIEGELLRVIPLEKCKKINIENVEYWAMLEDGRDIHKGIYNYNGRERASLIYQEWIKNETGIIPIEKHLDDNGEPIQIMLDLDKFKESFTR